MAIYQPNGGSGIGTLLRMIKEQRSQGPIVPPSAEVGSPIRNVVQGPLEAPESPGTQRMISVRPEAGSRPEDVAPTVGPVAPPTAPSVVAPVAPRPAPQAIGPSTGFSDTRPTGPSLGTSIKPSISPVSPTSASSAQRRVVVAGGGGSTRDEQASLPANPTPTPAPRQTGFSTTPGRSTIGSGGAVGGIVKNAEEKLNQFGTQARAAASGIGTRLAPILDSVAGRALQKAIKTPFLIPTEILNNFTRKYQGGSYQS